MKKFLLSLVALMAFGASAMADEIKVSPVELRQGGTGVMTIELVNPDGHHYRGFQFDITLPEGITMESATKGAIIIAPEGQYMFGTTDREVSEGNRYGFAYTDFDQQYGITESGVIVEITLKADASLQIGETYQAHFSGDADVRPSGSEYIEFTYDEEDGSVGRLHPADFDVDITIVENIITLDEESPEIPEIAENQKVLVKRTIKAGQWNTLCLPFDMTAEQVYGVFGDDVELAYLDNPGYTIEKDGDNITNININFAKDDLSEGFTANYPYIIKTTKDITEFELTVDINLDDVKESWASGKGANKLSIEFIGTYEAETIVPENNLFLSGGKFYYSTGATKMKAFRAYFNVLHVLSDLSAGVKMQVNVDGEPTRVNDLHIANTNGAAYTIDGKKINNTDNLPKGVYIIDGKKVAIK